MNDNRIIRKFHTELEKLKSYSNDLYHEYHDNKNTIVDNFNFINRFAGINLAERYQTIATEHNEVQYANKRTDLSNLIRLLVIDLG